MFPDFLLVRGLLAGEGFPSFILFWVRFECIYYILALGKLLFKAVIV